MRRATSGTGVPEPCQARSSSQYPPWSAAIFSSPSCQYGSESISVPSMSQNTALSISFETSWAPFWIPLFSSVITFPRNRYASFSDSYILRQLRPFQQSGTTEALQRAEKNRTVPSSRSANRFIPIGSRKPTHAQANSRKPTQQPTHSNGDTWKSPKCLRNEQRIRRNRSAAIAAIRHRPLLDESQDLRATTPEPPAPERPSRHSPPSSGRCNARRACSR